MNKINSSFPYWWPISACCQSERINDNSSKQLQYLRVQQTSRSQSYRRRTEDLHRKGHRESDENRPPSPSLPQLPLSASPTSPSHLPSSSPVPLPAEEGPPEEELAITLDTREALFPEGEEIFLFIYFYEFIYLFLVSHMVVEKFRGLLPDICFCSALLKSTAAFQSSWGLDFNMSIATSSFFFLFFFTSHVLLLFGIIILMSARYWSPVTAKQVQSIILPTTMCPCIICKCIYFGVICPTSERKDCLLQLFLKSLTCSVFF